MFSKARYCSISCASSDTTVTSNEDVKAYLLKHVVMPENPDACWEWQGRLNDGGYGMANVRQSSYRASRLSYEIFIGPIPDGLHVLHNPDPTICNNRRCINPQHLRCGTNYENMQDKQISGTQIKGETHYLSKLTEDDVREIRRLYTIDKWHYVDIAIAFDIDFVTVHNAVKAITWKHVDADTYVPPQGDGRQKITPQDIDEICRLRLIEKLPLRVIAERYGVHLGYVSALAKRHKDKFAS